MGLLDKLMFWKRDTVELEYDVEGCFTLPGAELDDPPQPEPADTPTDIPADAPVDDR